MDKTQANETAARLRRAVTQLNRRLRQSSLGGVSPAQASMLSSIEKLGSPSLGELAIREQVQPPSVTRMIRTLEDVGFVVLVPDSDDRRSTRVKLTTTGRRELSVIRRRKTEFLETKLRSLSPDEQIHATQLVDLLERLLDKS